MINVDDYTREEECIYKDERYSARDNGAVLRHPRDGKRPRPTDNQWTFGKPNDKNGYMKIGSARVHIIMATAFYGVRSTKVYVVDHIDANRRNNRMENLRWLTRLENVLSNPITRRNIEFICGCSAEEFLANPEKYRDMFLKDSSFGWMRTVSVEEGAACLANRLAWAESDRVPSGGTLDEWVYQPMVTQNRHVEVIPNGPDYILSLTHGAVQRKWSIPSEFPCCPQKYDEEPMVAYAKSLKVGLVFCQNNTYTSSVEKSAITDDKQSIYVISQTSSSIKRWALAKITYEDNLFVHTSCGTFFAREGAEKQFTLEQGLEWTGGDSIDDYC